MFSERKALLLRMLEIEDSIKKIEFNSDFRRIKANLKLLEVGSGRARISVGIPDDMQDIREIRKNSKEVVTYIDGYKVKLEDYNKRLEVLNREKVEIRKQLFP
jgi:hypothetical protein